MNKLAIIGAGDLGQLIAFHAPACGYEVVGFFDDTVEKGTKVTKHTVLGDLNSIAKKHEQDTFNYLIVGIGYKHFDFRKNVFQKYKKINIPFATLIHPSCVLMSDVIVGEGCFILPSCTLDKGVSINENVLLNTGVTIAHDTVIGAHSFLAPRVALAGFIKLGECCMVGTNATIINNVSIVNEVVIGAGAVVIKSIKEKGIYIGVPAVKM